MNRIFSLLGQRGCVAFVTLLAVVVSSVAYAQKEAAIPDAPLPAQVLTAQGQTPPLLPGSPQTSPAPGRTITLERALDLAKRINPTLQANHTLILQNKRRKSPLTCGPTLSSHGIRSIFLSSNPACLPTRITGKLKLNTTVVSVISLSAAKSDSTGWTPRRLQPP